ncbi:calcium/sodium antiporter [Candidatus Woesebacteria bacterium]|nr:calcium/sodium antiporter [Candidatus Woesebacteria bacterium]
MVIVYILILVLVFYLLAKICDEYFVKSLDLISKKMKLSEDVAGATFMAIGSSAPEFFTALIAVTKVGSEQVASGTIVGSAIFNILVIVGASAVVATSYLSWKPVIRDLVFYVAAIIVLLITFQDGVITMLEATFYLLSYAGYILLLANWKRVARISEKEDIMEMVSGEMVKEEKRVAKKHAVLAHIENGINSILAKSFPNLDKHPQKYVTVFAISILFIVALSWVLVEVAILLAHDLGIPEVIIALTILAGGTSIPDLLSSLIVAKQGRGDMAVSNAVGSNIFDIFVCLGLPWMLYILFTGKSMVVSTENLMASIFLLFFTVISILFLLIWQKFKLGPKSGYILLVLYGGYLVYSIYSAYFPQA